MRLFLMSGLMSVAVAAAATSSFADKANAQATTGVPQTTVATKDATPATTIKTDKQKALIEQTERLFDMATDLKAQVDKTNKNILSLTVVRDAEEIEALARRMKEQGKNKP